MERFTAALRPYFAPQRQTKERTNDTANSFELQDVKDKRNETTAQEKKVNEVARQQVDESPSRTHSANTHSLKIPRAKTPNSPIAKSWPLSYEHFPTKKWH